MKNVRNTEKSPATVEEVAQMAASGNNLTAYEFYKERYGRYLQDSGKAGWNWCAFLFGNGWFIYHKMYKEAAWWILLCAALVPLKMWTRSLAFGIEAIAWVAFGYFGNYFLFRSIERKISDGYLLRENYKSTNSIGKTIGILFGCGVLTIFLAVVLSSVITTMISLKTSPLASLDQAALEKLATPIACYVCTGLLALWSGVLALLHRREQKLARAAAEGLE